MITVQAVVLLIGFLATPAGPLPVNIEFVSLEECGAAKTELAKLHKGSRLSCLAGATHNGVEFGGVIVPP